MKKIIIYTTNDDIVSLHLVNKIVSDKSFKELNDPSGLAVQNIHKDSY